MWNYCYRSEKTFFPCSYSEVLLLLEEGCASVSVYQYPVYCIHVLTVFVLKGKECFAKFYIVKLLVHN